jgi:HlyD family secretion protein
MEEFSRAQQNEIRSAEVQEIISTIPSGLVRVGISIIFCALVSLLVISWFIRYPDVLQASVIITTDPAPHIFVSRQSSNITLLKTDNEPVAAGELVAYLKSNADPFAVLNLETALQQKQTLFTDATHANLGDLQNAYANAIKAEIALDNFLNNKSFDLQLEQLNIQLKTYSRLKAVLAKQQMLAGQELTLAHDRFKTDSILYIKEVLTPLDYTNAKATWVQQQRLAQNTYSALVSNEIQMNELLKQLADTEVKKSEEHYRLEQEVMSAREVLHGQIKSWKENYLFISPTEGRICYIGFLENNNFVNATKEIFSIIPHEGKIIARAQLPIVGAGKVKEGQLVNIRLDNYPFAEFGMLKGKVVHIADLPVEGKYQLILEIPQALITTQKKQLAFHQQLSGTTEIITEDLRLLERFFYQFRKILTSA